MCESFLGTWKLISSEKFDDYMKELGKTHLLNLVKSFFFFAGVCGYVDFFIMYVTSGLILL